MTKSYRPMTLAELAIYLRRATGDTTYQWKLFWEFMEEYRWEAAEVQDTLVVEEPASTGDERWNVLLAAIAEHLNAKHDLAPPKWTESRVLENPWFPAELPTLRAMALVWAPAAFKKHGVYMAARDLEAA